MEYPIKQLSAYAISILQSIRTGTVHSVYRRTINLTDGKRLLSLQADGSPLSPISLICSLSASEMNSLAVRPGDAVLFGTGAFHLQSSSLSYSFTYENAIPYRLELSRPLDAPSRPVLSSNIRTALSLAGTGGFALLFNVKNTEQDDLPLPLLAAKKHLLCSSELCLQRQYHKAALTLSLLLGLGSGLTPSGDDFLCGVLAGLCLTGSIRRHPFAQSLKSEIAAHLSDTIDISAAFLSCALQEQFSLPVNNLYDIPSPEMLLASFGEIGHSSGMDTLCGILWGIEHI